MRDTLAFRITALYRDFLSYTTAELKTLGLSFGQMPIIIYTGKHPDCTQSDLTKSLKLDWGYSQRSVTKLTEAGFLTKVFDEGRGCNCLKLTASGERAFEVSHSVFSGWDASRMKDFTEEEKRLIIALLGKLTAE